jgi:hypothetical protein
VAIGRDLMVTGGYNLRVHVSDTNLGSASWQTRTLPKAVLSVALDDEYGFVAAGCREGVVELWYGFLRRFRASNPSDSVM